MLKIFSIFYMSLLTWVGILHADDISNKAVTVQMLSNHDG
jgi:hypothetical protein